MPDEQESKKRKAEDSPEAEEINAVDSQAKLAIMVETTKVHDANEHHEGASSPKMLPVVEEAEDPIFPVDNAVNQNQDEFAKGAPKDSESEKIDAPSMDSVTNGENEQKDEDDNPYTKMRRCIVQNDGKEENMIRLIGLKNLFSKQLPKMPKEYIVRLVLDRRHKSLAILSDDPKVMGTDEEIIGGICYRAYHDMRFAEIAFCAVNQAQQVKGYGTKLMNLLKMHAATEGVEYFITYADNYATGYFKKQGFTRTITMPKSRFHGLIKDYDGGTLMECYVHPSIDYTRIPEMIEAQREFILRRIRTISKSDKVIYPPLPKGWTPNWSGLSSRGNEAATRAMAIPGMTEAGWTMADLLASTAAAKDNDKQRNHLKSELLAIVRKIEEQHFAWPFREPVDTSEVKDYLDVVIEPIDLQTMDKRIRKGGHYKTKKQLYNDMLTMVNNCKNYNDATSPYYECATNLEKFLKTLFPEN